jgi:hypothetical protein
MWMGRRFLLTKDLRAVEMIDGREIRTAIPRGNVVEVIQNFIRVVELRYVGRDYIASAVDLQACGEEVKERVV